LADDLAVKKHFDALTDRIKYKSSIISRFPVFIILKQLKDKL
jgi:hypothetical protein